LADSESYWPVSEAWATAADVFGAYDQAAAIAELELSEQADLIDYWNPARD
jgi:hypothetical protein